MSAGVIVLLSLLGGLPIASADPQSDEAYEAYYRDHIGRLSRDAYRRGQSLPERLIVPRDEAGDQLRRSMPRPATATWIGHSTFFVRMGGLGILTDPVFSSHASPLPPTGPRRTQPPGLRFADLPRIHVIVLSHGHYDHTDFPTLKRLADRDRRTVVFVPTKMKQLVQRAGFTRIVALDPGQRARIGGIRFTAIRAAHQSGRNYRGDDLGHALSWLIEAPKLDLLFVGDTSYSPAYRQMRRRRGAVDVVLVPIGAYSPREFEKHNHVNPEEAVRLARDVGARMAIAMHWGTFMLTPEPILEPPARFKRAGRGKVRTIVPKVGETIRLR